jgi:hypothetical protein
VETAWTTWGKIGCVEAAKGWRRLRRADVANACWDILLLFAVRGTPVGTTACFSAGRPTAHLAYQQSFNNATGQDVANALGCRITHSRLLVGGTEKRAEMWVQMQARYRLFVLPLMLLQLLSIALLESSCFCAGEAHRHSSRTVPHAELKAPAAEEGADTDAQT